MKFVSKGPVESALAEVMAWRWSGNKPLSEPMMAWFTDAYTYHVISMS